MSKALYPDWVYDMLHQYNIREARQNIEIGLRLSEEIGQEEAQVSEEISREELRRLMWVEPPNEPPDNGFLGIWWVHQLMGDTGGKMSEQESNICAICGGVKRVDWTISFEECHPVQVQFDPASLAGDWRLCPGHPEPAQKRGGKLNEDGTHNVYPNNFGGIAIHANDGITWMEAKEALSLLAWLKQEKTELQRLAKEQEG